MTNQQTTLCKPGRPAYLSPAQVNELGLLFPFTDNHALAALFGLSVSRINGLATKHRWKKGCWLWTDKEKQYLRDNYLATPRILTARQCANDLGREYWGVIRMIQVIKKELVTNQQTTLL